MSTGPLNWVRDHPAGQDAAIGWAAANVSIQGVYPGMVRVLTDRCTITATGATRGVEAATGLIRNSLIRSEYDGVAFRGGVASAPSMIEDCSILGPGQQISDWHQDGVQLWTGGYLTVRRTIISGFQNSAIFLKTDVGPIDSVLIQQCVLSCGTWFPIFARDGGHGRPTNVTVTGCVFDTYGGPTPISTGNDQQARYPDQETKFVRTEAARTDPTWIVWSGNVRPDGSEIAPPGGWLA